MAGLDMSETVAARLVAAIRGLYPELTAGKTDRDAVLAVAKRWAIEQIATWEGRKATPPLAEAVDQLATDLRAKQRAAEDKARAEAGADIK